jgi:4'-phosphopantetheinyl transferase
MEPAFGQYPKGGVSLQLWFAYPGDLADPETQETCLAVLDGVERARAARLKVEQKRHEFLATHALTRAALSHAHPAPPQSWRFSANEYGKPSLIPECGLRFNQSHSTGLAVCLLALPNPFGGDPAEVGVDIESFSRGEEILPLAPRVFSAAERAQLDALPAQERPDRALTLWTLKEAYVKARGMGLTLPLNAISFLFDGPQSIYFEVDPAVDDRPARWRFSRISHAGHRIALAVEAPFLDNPEIYEASPPLDPPARLGLRTAQSDSHLRSPRPPRLIAPH